MHINTRFAPSPTGHLHVGNARTALIAWLFCRANKGKFLLRLDDTDEARSTTAYSDAILKDLSWLGINWDHSDKQSDYLAEYDTALQKLIEIGRAYPCYESADELALKRKALLGRGLPPIYDRGALKLTDLEIKAFEAEGRKPHYRFKLNHTAIDWDDLVRGPQHFEGHLLSDPVLVREDGRMLYTLSSVVDDIRHKMTHIIRGEDHVANTATQIQLIEALGGEVPTFAHLSLIAGADGEGLSKRLGSLSLGDLRDEMNFEPIVVMNYLSKLGTSASIDLEDDLNALLQSFSFDKISRSTPKFNLEDLARTNEKYIHHMNFDQAQKKFDAMALEQIDEAFWDVIQPNLKTLNDAKNWWAMARTPLQPIIEDKAYSDEAAKLLPPMPWNGDTFSSWTGLIKEKTGRKGKELFMPLRLALTGQKNGPELKKLLPLLGHDIAYKRLMGETA